jgi:hypothetical protein
MQLCACRVLDRRCKRQAAPWIENSTAWIIDVTDVLLVEGVGLTAANDTFSHFRWHAALHHTVASTHEYVTITRFRRR